MDNNNIALQSANRSPNLGDKQKCQIPRQSWDPAEINPCTDYSILDNSLTDRHGHKCVTLKALTD